MVYSEIVTSKTPFLEVTYPELEDRKPRFSLFHLNRRNPERELFVKDFNEKEFSFSVSPAGSSSFVSVSFFSSVSIETSAEGTAGFSDVVEFPPHPAISMAKHKAIAMVFINLHLVI